MKKVTYEHGKTHITAENLNEIQDAILDLEKQQSVTKQDVDNLKGDFRQLSSEIKTVEITYELFDWSVVNNSSPASSENKIFNRKMAYGNGKYVYVGEDKGTYYETFYSTDGINWSKGQNIENPTNVSTYISSVIFNGSEFLAFQVSDGIFSSTDGITWTYKGSVGDGLYVQDAIYANNVHIAVGSNVLHYSTDAITWTPANIDLSNLYLYGIAYGNGFFVASGSNGTVATSIDGINWILGNSVGDANSIARVKFLNDRFMCFMDNKAYSSTTGFSWTVVKEFESGFRIANGLYLDDKYIIPVKHSSNNEYTLYYSYDAISWSIGGSFEDIQLILYEDNKLICIGDSIYSASSFLKKKENLEELLSELIKLRALIT